ncbi:OmpA family protein [Psychroserpens ponticola]|uniref:OmpA family protein n=1 Tax=Psychroserpens ponticola TaxID=2932268 RepID=A0ABY7S1P3_9FLAO|nr:OmpA family protein [Psychroserpens ponticola]WCO03058.1 OmpA family protein [Psychroserpens ponticola]
MMKTKTLILLFVLSSTFMIAQEKLADKFFGNYSYEKATELYKEVLKDGDTSIHVLTRLGDCYYNNSKSEDAALWYGKALQKYDRDVNPEYIYKYIQSLRSLGNYSEANEWMKKFTEIQNNDTRIKGYDPENISKFNELAKTEKDRVVKLVNLPFNSKYSDFGSFIQNGQLYFASSRNTDEKKLYSWNQEPFLDIYKVSVEKKGDTIAYGSADFINAEKINTDYHEASIAITNDGKTMYFTRDNVSKKNKAKYDKEGTTHLKLYKATLVGEIWTDIEELPFNDDVFSTGHPSLSPDNNILYFVSDREGGLGQTDIYQVEIKKGNTYSEPKNLGEKVNTEGREMFPFVSQDSTFYFSSDGHLNLGFLDIFKSNVIKDEEAQPENLGAPYNSGHDDFAFFLNPSEEENDKTGYFSSNRPDGQGSDDIYSFDASICLQTIKGITRDLNTNDIIVGATVKLINEVGKVLEEVETNENGEYEFTVDCNKKYTVIGSKEDYKDDLKEVTTDNENNKETEADLYLEPLINDNQIVINPIFFDFDKSNIRTDAQYELENIVDVMRAHPTMVIKIEAHTDSRGRDAYNMKLSDRRAKSTREYIISRGIAQERIESAIGYGESQLLNKCANRVKCTEEEHQLNRRSYFYILKE